MNEKKNNLTTKQDKIYSTFSFLADPRNLTTPIFNPVQAAMVQANFEHSPFSIISELSETLERYYENDEEVGQFYTDILEKKLPMTEIINKYQLALCNENAPANIRKVAEYLIKIINTELISELSADYTSIREIFKSFPIIPDQTRYSAIRQDVIEQVEQQMSMFTMSDDDWRTVICEMGK